MGLNLVDCVELPAREWPDNTAVTAGDFALTFAQLRDAVRRMSAYLRRSGLKPGDRVALLLPNTPHFPIAYYGILHAGCIAVPLNPGLTVHELTFILADAGVRHLIASHEAADAARAAHDAGDSGMGLTLAWPQNVPAEPAAEPDLLAELQQCAPARAAAETGPDDVAVIMYTGAYDGWPKGAQLTHFNLFQNASAVGSRMLRYTPADRCLAVLPLFHGFGQTVTMNAPLLAGAAVHLVPRFDAARTLFGIEREYITVAAFVPTMVHFMLAAKLDHQPDLRTLRIALTGGAAMPLERFDAFRERFGVTLLEGYGLTETSPVVSFNMSLAENRPGSVGKPLWGCEIRVVDKDGVPVGPGITGEVVVRGHNVMKGYRNHEEATAAAIRDGWFYTGDWGCLDEDGYLYLKGLKKDMLIRAGLNVYCREVERVLETHPDVREAAVVGIPDPVRGEEAKAVIAADAGDDALEKTLVRWCRERLAGYKCPRYFEFRAQLPRDARGAIDKSALAP